MFQRQKQRVWTEDEFREKYESYKTLLFRIAFSYMGNSEDCEDILQEAFLKLYYYAPELSPKEEKCWLIRVTINLCKNQLKSFWKRNRVSSEEFNLILETMNVEWQPEEKQVLFDLVSMAGKAKEILILHYLEGYSVKEIAKILGISESAVKMRLKRGREKLKQELELEFIN